jgi:molecular chaperone Hsp33
MLDVLLPIFKRDAEGLFGDEPAIRMSCPRCGIRYVITREGLEMRAGTV